MNRSEVTLTIPGVVSVFTGIPDGELPEVLRWLAAHVEKWRQPPPVTPLDAAFTTFCRTFPANPERNVTPIDPEPNP